MELISRYDVFIRKFAVAKGRGTIEVCERFNKHDLVLATLKRVLKRSLNTSFIILTKSKEDKSRWDKYLSNMGYLCYTVLPYTMFDKLTERNKKSSLVILDGIEDILLNGSVSSIVKGMKDSYVMGISYPLSFTQKKEISTILPVIDSIGYTEARMKGWIPDHVEYNLKINLTDSERVIYNKLDLKFRKLYPLFGSYLNIIDCLVPNDREIKGRGLVLGSKSWGEKIIKSLKEKIQKGILGDEFRYLTGYLKDDNREWIKGNRLGITVMSLALEARDAYFDRNNILYNSVSYVEAVKEIARKTNDKILIYSESEAMSVRLKSFVSRNSIIFSKDQINKYVAVWKSKDYKNNWNAKAFYNKNKEVLHSIKIEGNKVSWRSNSKKGKAKLIKEINQSINEKVKDTIIATKMLDMEVDTKEIEIAIILPSISRKAKHSKKKKRVILKDSKNVSYIVNIVPDRTKAVDWINTSQDGKKSVMWVDNVNSINFNLK